MLTRSNMIVRLHLKGIKHTTPCIGVHTHKRSRGAGRRMETSVSLRVEDGVRVGLGHITLYFGNVFFTKLCREHTNRHESLKEIRKERNAYDIL